MCEYDPHVNMVNRAAANHYVAILCHDFDLAANDEKFIFSFGDVNNSQEVIVPKGACDSERDDLLLCEVRKRDVEFNPDIAVLQCIKINGSCTVVQNQTRVKQEAKVTSKAGEYYSGY